LLVRRHEIVVHQLSSRRQGVFSLQGLDSLMHLLHQGHQLSDLDALGLFSTLLDSSRSGEGRDTHL
jgi:hypothetical protein